MVASACKLVNARRVSKQTGTSSPDREFDGQVVSAFGEAFNNVALHSYAKDGGDVEIEIETLHDRLTIRVMDFGKSFDPDTVPIPELDALPESGLGLYIIRSFMDHVSYSVGRPNVLCMTKFLVHEDDDLAEGVAGD